MIGLIWFSIIVLMLALATLGAWLHRECKIRRALHPPPVNRAEVQAVARRLQIQHTVYQGLLDQFPTVRARHLEIVREMNEKDRGEDGENEDYADAS